MIPHLYRFRPANAVLDGYEELAKQEIYFAAPEKLNDPMEGYNDVFWSGDLIVWRNLIRHYLLCLTHITHLCYAMGSEFDSADLKVLMFSSPDKLPDAIDCEISARRFAPTPIFRLSSKPCRRARCRCGATNSGIISGHFTLSPSASL
jgi:hypothetical protein